MDENSFIFRVRGRLRVVAIALSAQNTADMSSVSALHPEHVAVERVHEQRSRLIVVANRLPVRRAVKDGVARWVRADGGLVSALVPLLQRRADEAGSSLPISKSGAWIGWTGVAKDKSKEGWGYRAEGGDDEPPATIECDGLTLYPVHLSETEVENYYNRMGNRTFWPLYHDAICKPEFNHEWWDPYVRVNARFASLAARVASPGDSVWIHDYHLQLVPAMLRRLRPDVRIGFFLHIPFPPEELFAWIPWRKHILEGLLGADIVGFQTVASAHNFARACRTFTDAGGAGFTLDFDGRRVVTGAYPISIDFSHYSQAVDSPGVRERVRLIRSRVGEERKILLGIDRLDYTKGIDARLLAFEQMLQDAKNQPNGVVGRPAGVDNCVLIQVAIPSRDRVPEYKKIRADIEHHVGRINGTFGEAGRAAVHYLRRNLSPEELIAYYRAADVMLVTPFRDGMNLVAKEYVATRNDNTGVLVLSEFAGAASEMKRALLVNPHDTHGTSRVFAEALAMPANEASRRMTALRNGVRRHDVHRWAAGWMEAFEA